MIIIGFFGTVLYYIFILIFFLILTPLSCLTWVVTTPFDRQRKATHFMNYIGGSVILLLNPFWSSKIYGKEKLSKKETYIFTPNHQSLIDIPVLASSGMQFKWVAKKELTYVPFLGWLMGLASYVLLSRKDPKSQFKMMRSCENYIGNNMSIAIFPEGTRSGKEELGRFRDGASLLAKKTGTKIIPIYMSQNWKSMPHKLFIWTKKVNMEMYFLDPIDPSKFEKTKDISAAIKEAIAKKQQELA